MREVVPSKFLRFSLARRSHPKGETSPMMRSKPTRQDEAYRRVRILLILRRLHTRTVTDVREKYRSKRVNDGTGGENAMNSIHMYCNGTIVPEITSSLMRYYEMEMAMEVSVIASGRKRWVGYRKA